MPPQIATIETLRSLPRTLGATWFESLEERKLEEAAFHDADRMGRKDEAPGSTPNRRFYEAAHIVSDYVDQWLKARTPGAIFLDYACGNGSTSVAVARGGAALAVGIDISAVSIANATESASAAGVVGSTLFLQRDCENTGLPDQSFDAVLCSGMLHHVDLQRAFPELHRILRPGGRILAVEALAYNPVIQLYRELTPQYRTEWEKAHILSHRDLRFAKRWFDVASIKYFCFTSPLATLLPRPIRTAGVRLGHVIDEVLTRIPLIRLWSWQFAFELVRRDD